MEDLTPLYNKEFYLAYLCGENVVLPIPDGNAERYLAYLCGMDVTIPDVPDGRTETYLAYKCGEDVVLPDPLYRIEFYLAKWCGMDVEVPEPLYRIEYWLAQLANSGELKTVTGNPISVSDALARPAESLVIEILPQQSGSGDPSPDNVRPITGWTGVNIPRTGKNLIENTGSSRTQGGVTFTVNNDGSIDISGSHTSTVWWRGLTTISDWRFLPAGTYKLTGGISNDIMLYLIGNYVDGRVIGNPTVTGGVYDKGSGLTFTLTGDAYVNYQIQVNGNTETDLTIYPMISLDGGEYEPYTGTTYSIDWTDEAGTVYGGELDVTTGVLTVDRAMVDLGTWDWAKGNANNDGTGYIFRHGLSGSPLNADAISDRFAKVVTPSSWEALHLNEMCMPAAYVCICANYASVTDFKTAMSGAQLCYELATPLTIQLTATEVQMLLGNNVIWNDINGDMTLEYLADGPADDIDALQILLNNRYVNNGEPDEATDREALEILLGGR